jgi:hypothetical protein
VIEKHGNCCKPIIRLNTAERESVQSNKLGINIDKTTLDVLDFTDDLNLVEENKEMVE